MITQKIIYLILVIFLAVLMRFIYHIHAPSIYVSEDTYLYFEIGQKMLSDKSFVNDWRTPVYPVLLNLPMLFTRFSNSPILSPITLANIYKIILLQSFIGIGTLLILYWLLVKLKVSSFYALLIVLFTGVNPILFGWEILLLPESLTVFFLVSVSFVTIHILQKPTFVFFLILFLLFVFGVFLRPIYFLLPFGVLAIIICHLAKRKILFVNLILLTIFLSIIGIYIISNSQHGYPGISRVSDINLLGKILQFQLPIEAGKNEVIVYDAVSMYRKNNKDLNPWRFLDNYTATFNQNPDNLNALARFNKTVIMHNLPTFIFYSIQQLPASLVDISDKYILRPASADNLFFLFNLLFHLYHNLQYATLIIFVAYPVSFYQFLARRNLQNTSFFLIGTIAMYQIIFVVFFSYGEYGRLISPSQPLLYLFSFFWWGKIFDSLVRIVQKPYPAKRKTRG